MAQLEGMGITAAREEGEDEAWEDVEDSEDDDEIMKM